MADRMLKDMPDEGNAEILKRKAIQDLMKDKSLTPVERNTRMQQIMAGNLGPAKATTTGRGKSDEAVASGNNTNNEESQQDVAPAASSTDNTSGSANKMLTDMPDESNTDLLKRKAIREMMNDKSLTPAQRNERMKQIMVGNFDHSKDASKNDPQTHAVYFSTINSANRGDGLEERITKNKATNVEGNESDQAAKAKRAFISSSLVSSRKSMFEERLQAKLKNEENERSGLEKSSSADGNSGASEKMRELEERIRNKANNSGSEDDGLKVAATQQRETATKAQPGDFLSSSMSASNRRSNFEAKLRDKLNATGSPSNREPKSPDMTLQQTNRASLSSSMGTQPAISAAGDTEGSESEANQHKRRAIKEAMQDKSLTQPQRNQRLQQIMTGKWDYSMNAPSEPDSNLTESSEAVNTRPPKALFMKAALEAKIAAKLLKKSVELQQAEDLLDDNFNQENEIDTESIDHNGSPLREENAMPDLSYENEDTHSADDYDNRLEEARPGVGFGSMPLPEEHFGNESSHIFPQTDEMVADDEVSDNPNHGLAVATAVAEDDAPDFVYAAIEYDPNSKPPLHKHRRFRIYTFVAMLIIIITVILMVVYITKLSKADTVVNQRVQFSTKPTQSPTPSPTTGREASGILEQLEAGVLKRGQTFAEMDIGDPRLAALEWILHHDGLQLVSDDSNLYQRFVLAIMAYSFDSFAWYVCGSLGENFNFTEYSYFPTSECSLNNAYTNVTESYGVWLSSTSECTWYGVICTPDGVIRGIELVMNDLIGQIPLELSAMGYLQYLALPGNCIFGTIAPEIGELHHLLSLELHSNGLSGELPNEIYDLENLQLLNLAQQYGNERECTKSNGTKVNIKYQMGGRTETGNMNLGLMGELDSRIGGWRAMKGLHLFQNSFAGTITSEIGNLRYLTFLQVSDNFIEGQLPDEITKLKDLRYLKIDDNFMYSTLPADLGNMKDLEILMVNGNSMYGQVPDSLYNLKKLEVLRLDETLSAESPWVEVSNEGFTGSISTEIGTMKNLKWLTINANPMSGTIPTELGLCEDLMMVRLHRTNIAGTMPMSICKLRDSTLFSNTNGVLYADCRPNNRTGEPFVICDCCSDCCDHTSQVCVADD